MPRQRSNAPPKGTYARSRSSSTTSRSGFTPFTSGSRNKNLPTVQPKKAETKPTPAAAPAAAPSAGRSTGDVMKDMAATAAGVAVGSAVGHAVGAGITGAFSGGGKTAAAATAEQPAAEQKRPSELVEEGPCAFEIRQFLKCSEENTDLNVCQDFNEAMKRCRQRYNA